MAQVPGLAGRYSACCRPFRSCPFFPDGLENGYGIQELFGRAGAFCGIRCKRLFDKEKRLGMTGGIFSIPREMSAFRHCRFFREETMGAPFLGFRKRVCLRAKIKAFCDREQDGAVSGWLCRWLNGSGADFIVAAGNRARGPGCRERAGKGSGKGTRKPPGKRE